MIAGVKKCGTSALKKFISQHPQTQLVTLYATEGHFFDIACLGMTTEECLSLENIQKFYYGPELKYNSYFNPGPGLKLPSDYTSSSPYTMFYETTPAYFTTPGAAHRLKLYNPNIKIILVTCDPVNRALSDYRHSIVSTSRPIDSGHYINVKRMATHQYLNSSIHFENIVDQALNDIEDKNDLEIYQMAAEKHKVENEFWRKANGDDNQYSTSYISEMFKNETSRISFNPLSKMVIDGMYDIYLTEWLKHFKLNSNLIIIDNNNLRDDPFTEVERAFSFLELESFLTQEMFYKPADSPFYCLDRIGTIKQSNLLRKKLKMNLLPIQTNTTILESSKLWTTEDGRTLYLDCKSGNRLLRLF